MYPLAPFLCAPHALKPKKLLPAAFRFHNAETVVAVFQKGVAFQADTNISAFNKKYENPPCRRTCNLIR